MLKNDININGVFCVSVPPPPATHSVAAREACTHAHTPAPLRGVMIHSSARAHGVLTKASSLPREHTLLSMPDSLSACQGMKKTKHMDPAGGLARCGAAITAVSCPNGKQHRQADNM